MNDSNVLLYYNTYYSMFRFVSEPSQCTANGHEAENGLGDEIDFSGCGGVTVCSPDSGMTEDDFDTVAFWQRVCILYFPSVLIISMTITKRLCGKLFFERV